MSPVLDEKTLATLSRFDQEAFERDIVFGVSDIRDFTMQEEEMARITGNTLPLVDPLTGLTMDESREARRSVVDEFLIRGLGERASSPLRFFNQYGRSLSRGVQHTFTNLSRGIDSGLRFIFEALGADQTDATLFRELADGIDAIADRINPDDPDFKTNFFATEMPRAVGSMVSTVGAALLTGGTSAAGQMVSAGLLGAVQQAEIMRQEAEDAGASPEDRLTAYFWGLGIGSTEAFPVGQLAGRFTGRIARSTASGAANRLIKLGRFGHISRDMLQAAKASALENAAQGAFAQAASESVAKRLYDPERDNWAIAERAVKAGIFEGAIGGVLGAAVGQIGLSRKQSKTIFGREIKTKAERDAQGELLQSGPAAVRTAVAEKMIRDIEEPLQNLDAETLDRFQAFALPRLTERGLTLADIRDNAPEAMKILERFVESEGVKIPGVRGEEVLRPQLEEGLPLAERLVRVLRQFPEVPNDLFSANMAQILRIGKSIDANAHRAGIEAVRDIHPRGAESQQTSEFIPEEIVGRDDAGNLTIQEKSMQAVDGAKKQRKKIVPLSQMDPRIVAEKFSSRIVVLRDQLRGNQEQGLPFRYDYTSADQIRSDLDRILARLAEAPAEVQTITSETLAKRDAKYAAIGVRGANAGLQIPELADYFHREVLPYKGREGSDPMKTRVQERPGSLTKSLAREFDPNISLAESDAATLVFLEKRVRLAEQATLIEQQADVGAPLRMAKLRSNKEKALRNPDTTQDFSGLLEEAGLTEGRAEELIQLVKQRHGETEDILFSLDQFLQDSARPTIAKHLGRDITELEFEHSVSMKRILAALRSKDGDIGRIARDASDAMQLREIIIRDRAGAAFEDWKGFINKDTHEIVPTIPGGMFDIQPSGVGVRVSAAQQQIIDQIGISGETMVDLAEAGDVDMMVLPKAYAKQMRELSSVKDAGRVDAFTKASVGKWKMWTLFAPHRVGGYFFRNLLGDTDFVVAANPGTLLNVFDFLNPRRKGPSTIQEALDFMSKDKKTPAIVSEAAELGQIDATITESEISSIAKSSEGVRNLMKGGKAGVFRRLARGYFKTSINANQLREITYRLAAYKARKAQMASGKKVFVGGANADAFRNIRATLGDNTAAAYLARQDLGDYGDLSVVGEWLRTHAVPFWSWNEVNARRYGNLVKNIAKTGFGKDSARAGIVLSAGLALRMAAVTALAAAFNERFFPEIEETLGDFDRANPHLILGKHDDGTAVILRNISALGDFLEWGGINDLGALMPMITEGQISPDDVLEEMAKAPLNKFINGLGPHIKGPFELSIGLSTFPDVTRPHRAKRGEIAAGYFGLRDLYKATVGFPIGERARPHQLSRLIGVTDPRQEALFSTFDFKDKFLRTKGKTSRASLARISIFKPVREAATFNDFDAFRRAKAAYLKRGGSVKKLKSSLVNLDPLKTGLNRRERVEFLNEFLTAPQRARVETARNYGQRLAAQIAWWWSLDDRGLRPEDTR